MHLLCPKCGSKSFKRNGYTRHGKQNHRCFDCGRQFSFDRICVTAEEPDTSHNEVKAFSAQFELQVQYD